MLCSQIPSCFLVEKAFISSRAMYIGIPLYALSSCHPVNPSVAIECVHPCCACEYFNVLSIYRVEHVFREYQRDTDHPYHPDISVINVTLNSPRGTNPPESQQTTRIAGSRFAHGVNSIRSQDEITFFKVTNFRAKALV